MIAMPRYTIEVTDKGVRTHLLKLPPALRSKLTPVISDLTHDMLDRARAAEPSRTGQLRAHTRSFVDVTEEIIRGRVRVLGSAAGPAIAAAAIEYGAHRRFPVREYQRRGIIVRAYERTANIAAQRFLRSTAESIADKALEKIEGAIDKAVEEVNAS